jgi:hypothetical protein
MTPKENLQIIKMNKKLNKFLAIALTVFVVVMYLTYDNAGFKKEIRSELKGFKGLLEMHISISDKSQESIKKAIENNRLNHQDLATDLLEKNVIKKLTLRNGTIQ